MKVEMKNADEVKTFLSRMPRKMFDETKEVFQKNAFDIEGEIKSNATTKLKVRTGNLRRSFGSEVTGNKLANLGLSIYAAGRVGGDTVVYAPVHEFGATIKAKNAYRNVPGGPYLNIPAPANKTPAGVQRMSARMVFNQGGYIAGKVVYQNGRPMFYLVKSVTIPARLGMFEAVESGIPTILSDLQNIDLE